MADIIKRPDGQPRNHRRSDSAVSAKRNSVFDGLIASLKYGRADGSRTPATASDSVGHQPHKAFDLRKGHEAVRGQVMDIDTRSEVLLCVYDKGSPEPVVTLVTNPDGTRTLLADGDAVALLSSANLELSDVVLYQRNV